MDYCTNKTLYSTQYFTCFFFAFSRCNDSTYLSLQHAQELAQSRLGDESESNVYSHTMFEWDYAYVDDCGVVEYPEMKAFCAKYTR